jgi:heme-degrading monooxygenase HmoA
MIVRVYRATVSRGGSSDFEEIVRSETLAQFTRVPGLVSWVAGRPLGAAGEFAVVTVWEDLESLQRFVGPDWQREGVMPAEALALLEETVLHHYEVFASSSP